MEPSRPEAGDLVIERLLRVIDEGRRVATYKLALLLGLIDAAAMSPGASELPTRLIAERVLRVYYPQVREYVRSDGVGCELRQITLPGAGVLRAIGTLRAKAGEAGCRSLDSVRTTLPKAYQVAINAVERKFVEYPIPLLQVIGGEPAPFLYSVDWPAGTALRNLRQEGRDRIRLMHGVADRLAVLGPMLRPLIELHWVRDVAKWNKIGLEDDRLHAHLFGAARVSFPPRLVKALIGLQDERCFCCGDQLPSRVEVDHFLAWSRWPNDAIENLVIADRCNSAKSDHLAAKEHLVHWQLRLGHAHDELREIAGRTGWWSDPARSEALVRTTYAHVPAGTPMWLRSTDFEIADGPLLP